MTLRRHINDRINLDFVERVDETKMVIVDTISKVNYLNNAKVIRSIIYLAERNFET